MSFVSAQDNETYSDDENFTQLIEEVNNVSDTFNMTKNYTYVEGEDNLILNKSMTINGNNHSMTVNSTIFQLKDNNTFIFKDIRFIVLNELEINTTSNITFFDSEFIFNNTATCAEPLVRDGVYGYTGKISADIVKLAKSIVGKSKDLEAAKKLAIWVGKHIKHKSHAGFYQTPSMTVKLRRGNCCSQTDLFLQMCDAIGLTKTHKLYYVHVGFINYGYRHFFAMIDNILVDPDSMPDNPWGHASIAQKRSIFSVTQYPMLPLSRNY